MEFFFISVRPAKTPRIEVMASATVEPSQTAAGRVVLLNPAAANCVLSPNSATVI